jgi:hypothetical protein
MAPTKEFETGDLARGIKSLAQSPTVLATPMNAIGCCAIRCGAARRSPDAHTVPVADAIAVTGRCALETDRRSLLQRHGRGLSARSEHSALAFSALRERVHGPIAELSVVC